MFQKSRKNVTFNQKIITYSELKWGSYVFSFYIFPYFFLFPYVIIFLWSSITYDLYKKQYVVISECSAARQWCVIGILTLHFFIHFSISVTHICFQCFSSKRETNKHLFPGKCGSYFSFLHFRRTRNQPFKSCHGWSFSRHFYILEWDIMFSADILSSFLIYIGLFQ